LSLSAVTDKVTRGLVLVTASAGICYHAPWVSGSSIEKICFSVLPMLISKNRNGISVPSV
jgi:hypothetical protein